MNKEKNLEVIESLQKTVEQMKIDDIEESPESAYESFQCQCCGEEKFLAGSVTYNEHLLCNDCVLTAEISFALDKIKNIDELIASMEDKRFDNVYNSIFEQDENADN
ncbi:MAG: hypothetical protein A2104_07725 [Candidatus Melainabacteria bacterium GWF2_32_7]|nr:MAG: hypothetical protein A2104_07725 [Candidatus Melainabacteria bacterium GWF2_32_7]